MNNNRFNVKQIIILFFVVGLMNSCSKDIYDNLVVQQLMDIKNVDFDKVEGVKHFITEDSDTALAWITEEMKNGRIASVKPNKETGEYTCKSILKGKVSLPAEDKILDLLDENGEFLLEDED